MFLDIKELKEFYDSPQGEVVQKLINKKINLIWPNLKNQKVLAIGYPIPFCDGISNQAERLIIAMPAAQGVIAWPKDRENSSLLTYEHELPFPDCFFDCILIAHIVENTESLKNFLREIWRVLADHGKILIILPNRKGLWSQLSQSPFGHGKPFTTRQIRNVLEKSLFTFLRRERLLYMPPFPFKFILRSASTWEKAGHKFYRSFSGLLMIEAEKMFYADYHLKIMSRKILLPKEALNPAKKAL